MTPTFDVVVVGSGPSGAQAAHTLTDAGLTVALIDVGFATASNRGPRQGGFLETRRTDSGQHAFFLGEDFGGVPLHPVGAAPQVTPPRQHILALAQGHKRIVADAFAAIETHALGGLGSAWGAVSFPYHDVELERSALPLGAMRASYERVARRVGISGTQDDLLTVRGPLDALQPTLPADHNGTALLSAYERRRARFARRGLFVGRPLLAALSQPLGPRAAHAAEDLDFWANPGDSVYRPEQTIQELQTRPNFVYHGGWRVESFREASDGVVVSAVSTDGALRREFTARRLVLAAGALGTARIALKSLGAFDHPVPLVCNAHLYIPALHWRQLGRPHAERCHSLAQLTLIHDPTGDRSHLVQAQMYSYRSLLLFRTITEVPLPGREALWAMRALAPSIVIWAVEHEEAPSIRNYCRMRCDGTFEAVHPVDDAVEQERRKAETSLRRGMRMLGCWPVRTVHSGPGSSLHYGGQFPFQQEEKALTTDRHGRLRGTRAVHIADGAALRYLPAKGLTLTLMANADRVALHVAESLRESATLSRTPM